MVLTDPQQYDVGERMMAASMRGHYFADLCSRYASRQKGITWAILFCSSGATATLFSDLPPHWTVLRPSLTLGTAALRLVFVVQKFYETSTDCADLHAAWNHLATEYEALWHDLDCADGLERLTRLVVRG